MDGVLHAPDGNVHATGRGSVSQTQSGGVYSVVFLRGGTFFFLAHSQIENFPYGHSPTTECVLANEVGEWNSMLAGLVGQLKDQFGSDFIAPITEFPDFEHLEADGRSGSPEG